MDQISIKQIRQVRLHAHHLDTWYGVADAEKIAGACGFQNSPPGAWERAFHQRIPDCKLADMRRMLEVEKTLLQSWSFRGAPVIFPTSESDTFLTGLLPEQNEPWIYIRGIQLALDFLQMPLEEILPLMIQIMPKLDCEVLQSKTMLDQTVAQWITPLLPGDKKDLWNKPSMYGNPERQTVGGAVVSFLLRPCALLGLVVFGERAGIQPTFTSYSHWVGHSLEIKGTSEQKIARKYLHCFAPASIGGFADWLGCSFVQAERMWQTVIHEVEPVFFAGKERFVLSDDKQLLLSPPACERKVHLLTGHDPYLGLRDREIILQDKARQKQMWQTVSNPGAVLWEGEIIGFWKAGKKRKALEIEITLWDDVNRSKEMLQDLCEDFASFQECKLNKIIFSL